MRRRIATCAASFCPKKARSGGDSAEVARAGDAVEAVGDFGNFDEGGGAGGIHLVDGRREEDIDLFGAKQVAVGVEGARVFGEVLGGAELLRVDEDGRHHDVAGGARGMDQREMAFVERAHGGHESDGAALCSRGGNGSAGFSNRADDLHQARRAMVERSRTAAVSFGR
jgi:hypothetical protein